MTAKYETTTSDLFDNKIDILNKTIFLTTDTGADSDAKLYEQFRMGMHILDSSRPRMPINIFMNHTGGDESCNMAIYDTIKNCVSETIITVYGSAESMGAWILQAADKRIMMPSSYMMIHIGETSLPSDHYRNNIAAVEMQKKSIPKMEDILLNRIREKKPRFTRKKLQGMLDINTFLTPQEAIEIGLADEIG